MSLPSLPLGYTVQRIRPSYESDPESGHYVRRYRAGVTSRTYSITWPMLTPTEYSDLLSAYDAAKGEAGSVSLTDPQEGALTCRFVGDLQVVRASANTFACTIAMESVDA